MFDTSFARIDLYLLEILFMIIFSLEDWIGAIGSVLGGTGLTGCPDRSDRSDQNIPNCFNIAPKASTFKANLFLWSDIILFYLLDPRSTAKRQVVMKEGQSADLIVEVQIKMKVGLVNPMWSVAEN